MFSLLILLYRINYLALCCIFSIFSIFIKKDNKIIVIGGWYGQRFADNSRYLFLYLNNNKNKLGLKNIIWITSNDQIFKELNSNGFEAIKKWSFKSFYFHIRAKYHIIDQTADDINPLFSGNSIRINLWHGFPLKKIGSFLKPDQDEVSFFSVLTSKFLQKGFWGNCTILTTSQFSNKILKQAFNAKKTLIASYPRNDIFFHSTEDYFIPKEEKKFIHKINNAKYIKNKRIIFYLPTFRDKSATLFLGESNNEKIKDFIRFLNKNNLFLVTKFHFANTFTKNSTYNTCWNNESLLNLNHTTDIYNILKISDILITDYSSVYFDYLLLNRPIIFHSYDLEYYKNHDRGLIFNYDEMTPGDKTSTLTELKNSIISNLSNPNKYSTEIKLLNSKINDPTYFPGCLHITNFLFPDK